LKAEVDQRVTLYTLAAPKREGERTFRHSWSVFATGREHSCPFSGLGGLAGDTQKRIKEEARTQAGLRRAGEWHSTPVGEKIERGRKPQEGQPAMGW
jgi:hypothetical protein